MSEYILLEHCSDLSSESEYITTMCCTDDTNRLIEESLVEYSEESLGDDPMGMNSIYFFFLHDPDEVDES